MTAPASARRQLRHDLAISALALVSVGIGLYELARPDPRFSPLDALDLAIVAVFLVDFVRHARRSGDARRYVRGHWWELPSLVPVTGGLVEGLGGISVIRGVRLLRLARAVRLLRILGVAARLRRVRRYLGRVAKRARVATIGAAGALVVALGALAATLVEASNPRLATWGDALWWSLNVFTTVAYVDHQPATGGGRVLAGLLMVAGVAFIGVFTASLANAILKEPPEEDEAP